MISAVVVRHDLDWSGFAVVMGMLALMLLALVPGARELFRRNDDWLKDFAQEGLDIYADVVAVPEVDHVDCANADCDQTICACRKPAECPGCTTLGCSHGVGLCWDCRLGCTECAAEHRALIDLDWVNGR